jgi:hypothetical protein
MSSGIESHSRSLSTESQGLRDGMMRRRRESVEKREQKEAAADDGKSGEGGGKEDDGGDLPPAYTSLDEGKTNDSLSEEGAQLRAGLTRRRRESVEKRQADEDAP